MAVRELLREKSLDMMSDEMLKSEKKSDEYQDPDEMKLEEKLAGYNLKSLDLCYEEAKDNLHMQVRNIEDLNARTLSLLGSDGVLLAVLVALWSSISATLKVPVCSSAFILLAGFLIVVSALCSLIAQRLRGLKGAPRPQRLVEKYITWTTTLVKYQNVYEILKAIRLNEEILDKMSWWLKVGMVFLAAALLSLLIAFTKLVLV